ncbi:MAG: hypothetical protein ACI906_000654, partial [Candidatus Latescibacterota bacterium]
GVPSTPLWGGQCGEGGAHERRIININYCFYFQQRQYGDLAYLC